MLPLDVIDHILSLLQWDRAALTLCSEAHPFLSRIAEKYLYTHLTVEGHHRPCSESNTFDQFQLYKILRDNPRIANYVRSLRIEASGLVPDKLSKQKQTLHHILAILPFLERIALTCPTDVVKGVWIHFPKKFQKAFLDCLRLPTMRELSLSDITDFPLTNFDHSRTLKKLSLRGYTTFNAPEPASSSYPPFDGLSLFCCPPSPPMISWARTQTMRSLKMGGLEVDFQDLPLLQVWASSLTSLDLDLGYGFRSEFNPSKGTTVSTDARLSLPKLLVLEQITVRSTISLHHQIHKDKEVLRFYKAAFPAIVALILGLTSPSLKRITLHFHLSFNGPFSFSDVDWSPLETLSRLGIPIELRISANQTTFHIPPVDILQSLRKVDSLTKLVERHALVLRGEEQHTHPVWFNI